MRIGIDFDNTIICYDQVFCDLAKSWKLIHADYQGSKQELRDLIFTQPGGEREWMRLQGKAYGELVSQANVFEGFKEFIMACNAHTDVSIFIVSHKTEFGHFDEKRISLRAAAKKWLRDQGFFNQDALHIPETNIFFETTREEKIKRIQSLQCTHFIDDLVEVLYSPLFPSHVERLLFRPEAPAQMPHYTNWIEIKNALFPQ